MADKLIKSIADFKSSPDNVRADYLAGEIEKEFIEDIYRQLKLNNRETLTTAMILAGRLKLIDAVPALYDLVDPKKFFNPLGNLNPTSIIIQIGSEAFNKLMDCVNKPSSRIQLSTVSKVIFYWWLSEPEKMMELINERNNRASQTELEVINGALSEMKKNNA